MRVSPQGWKQENLSSIHDIKNGYYVLWDSVYSRIFMRYLTGLWYDDIVVT